jgi:hypothetical protein
LIILLSNLTSKCYSRMPGMLLPHKLPTRFAFSDKSPYFRRGPSIFCASSIVIINVIGSIADARKPQCS